MSIIVTGSAGYIGGQTALLLRDLGYTVYGIDRREPPRHLQGVVDGFLYQDFASDVALSWIIQKRPDAIIHCAAQPSHDKAKDFPLVDFLAACLFVA